MYSAGFSGSLQKIGKNYYLCEGVRDTSKERDGVLLKFTSTLDTVWFKRYNYMGYNVFRSCKPTPDGGLIIVGETNPNALHQDIWLVKVDSMGNVQWEKSYGGSKFEAGSTVQVLIDGYLVGGYTNSYGAGDFDAYLIKVDTLGKEIWSKTYGDKNTNGGFAVTTSKYGGFIGSGVKYDTTYFGTYDNGHPSIIRLDSLGNLLWEKIYVGSRYGSGFGIVHELNDGSIVASGQINDDHEGGGFKGMLIKTNSQGDSLWYREYEYNPCPDNNDYIRDMKPTRDGGFIMAGFFHLSPSKCPGDTGTQDMWVIKLDSIGCPYPNCDTIVGVIPLFPELENVEVYPNPANEHFSLKGNVAYPLTVELYDVQGRKVNTRKVVSNTPIPIHTVPKGLYIYTVIEHTGKISRGKVIIE